MKKIFAFAFMAALSANMHGQERKVLIEERTSTTCGGCPSGKVYASTLEENYPGQFVFISVHSDDPMQYAEYAEATGQSDLPAGMIDRTITTDLNPFENLDDDMTARLAVPAPANISIQTIWDDISRQIIMVINAEMNEDLSGDYRLAAVVVEDGITGVSQDYDQANSYADGANGPMGGYEDDPNPVPANKVAYHHVARHLPGGYMGDENSLPEELLQGETYSYSYSYTLPQEYFAQYVKIVAYMIDVSTGEILNAGEGNYLPGYSNAPPFVQSIPVEAAYLDAQYEYAIVAHDPDYDNLTISTESTLPAGLSFEDLGDGEALISGTALETGTFEIVVTVEDGTWSVDQEYELSITEPSSDWILVGEEGFTDMDIYNSDLAMTSAGEPMIMTMNGLDQLLIFSYDEELDEWTQFGSPLNVDPFQASFCLDNSDNPVAFDGAGKVWQMTDGDWVQVGEDLPLSSYLYTSIIVSEDDHIHAVYFDSPNDESKSVEWDGSEWLINGPFTDDVAIWNNLKRDDFGQPAVIYGTDETSSAYSEVAIRNSGEWEVLGGTYIEPNFPTYFDHDFAFKFDGTCYAALTIGAEAQQLNIYEFDGEGWSLHTADLGQGPTASCSIEIDDDGQIYVAYRDENQGGRTTVKRFNGSNWTYVGLAGFTNPATDQIIKFNNEGVPFVAYQDGSYAGNMSCKKFDTVEENPDGIAELSRKSIDLYPNPSTGLFRIEGLSGNRFDVFNTHGKLIKSGLIKAEVEEIDLGHVAPGIYVVRVMDDQYYHTGKVIIQ